MYLSHASLIKDIKLKSRGVMRRDNKNKIATRLYRDYHLTSTSVQTLITRNL